jgi:CRISPR-associated protein Cas2
MRNLHLVTYDISDAKRLRRVFRKMMGFGDPVQYSVFLCSLSRTERVLMMDALRGVMNQAEDRVLVVDLGPVEGRGEDRFEYLGVRLPPPETGAIVV